MSANVDIRVGDCLDVLRTLDAGSAQTCVTSPPYFGLRDYGVAGQIGLEATPTDFVAKMVEVFAEVRRVLADDGTLWLNLGDSYAGSWGAQSREHAGKHAPNVSAISANQVKAAQLRASGTGSLARTPGLKAKDLIGIPWRVALALQADGWYLRSDIIWHKPNPMPESVVDRPTKAHEYLFLLAKSERYYYDSAAIQEDAVKGAAGSEFHTGKSGQHQLGRASAKPRQSVKRGGFAGKTEALADEGRNAFRAVVERRNRRSVWTVATRPFGGAHFATFPPALIEPCILAGSRVGDTVLDPFGGAGTTALVAARHSRSALLIELNPEYAAMARTRVADDCGLFAEGA